MLQVRQNFSLLSFSFLLFSSSFSSSFPLRFARGPMMLDLNSPARTCRWIFYGLEVTPLCEAPPCSPMFGSYSSMVSRQRGTTRGLSQT